MQKLNIALILEQTLGHITHAQNLQACLNTEPHLQPHWIEVPFDLSPYQARLPLYNNWSVRASWRARRSLNALGVERMDGVFFHTQVTSLFSIDLMHRVPTVISLDATPLNYDTLGTYYNHKPDGDGAIDSLKFWLNRHAFHAAVALVTWSDWVRRSLIADYSVDPERIHVIPPGIHIDDWTSAPRVPHDGPVRILFVGGDFKRKGGPLLLEAWRQHLRDRAELHIVTQSEVAPEPGIHVYYGLKPNSPALRQLFFAADIFALPTLGDTLGIVFAEAGAAQLPTVSTAIAGIPEVVCHGESGLLCPPGDINAFAAALSQLVDNPDMRALMGIRAGEIVAAHFDARKNTRRLVQLLSECAEKRKFQN